MSDYSLEAGRLDVDMPSRRDGRKVMDWTFHPAGGQAVPVTVSLMRGDGGGVYFHAASKALPEPLEHTDIEQLRARVEATLVEQASMLSGIQWEDWLEVKVTGSDDKFTLTRFERGFAGDLSIEVNRLKRGISPKSGEPVTIHRGHVIPFPEASALSAGGREIDGIRLSSPEERSYIPATPENVAALKAILERLSLLRSNLASLLSQEQVASKLADIGAELPLLLQAPSADGEGDAADARRRERGERG